MDLSVKNHYDEFRVVVRKENSWPRGIGCSKMFYIQGWVFHLNAWKNIMKFDYFHEAQETYFELLECDGLEFDKDYVIDMKESNNGIKFCKSSARKI